MDLEIYVKENLFYRKQKRVYIVDKNGIGHSRDEIEEATGISVRMQQALMKNRREKKGSKGEYQTVVSAWKLEKVCGLAEYLGYTVAELFEFEGLEEMLREIDLQIEKEKRRKSEWENR